MAVLKGTGPVTRYRYNQVADGPAGPAGPPGAGVASVAGSGFLHNTAGALDAAASHGAANQLLFGGNTDVLWAPPLGDVSLVGQTFTVTGIQGKGVSSTAPTEGQFLIFGAAAWAPTSLSGDVSASIVTPGALTVTKIQGNPVTTNAPTANYVLAWTGSAWNPTNVNSLVTSFTPGGDLTGSSTSQTVVKISGAAPVNVVNGSLSFGTNPASTGAIRLPNAVYAYARNAANSGDIRLVGTTSGNALILGDTSNTGAYLYSGGTLNLQLSGANTIFTFDSRTIHCANIVVSPILTHDAQTTDTATTNLTIQSQGPYASATTNKTPGNIIFNTPAPVSGGLHGLTVFQDGGANQAAIGNYDGVSGGGNTYAAMWLGPSVTPSASNYTFVQSTTTLQLNAPSGGTLIFNVGNVNEVSVAAGAMYSFADIGVNLGSASFRWKSVNAGPNGIFVYHASGDANPTVNLTDQTLTFGPGAASAVDCRLGRSSSGTFQFDNAVNGGDGTINISSSGSGHSLSLASATGTIAIATQSSAANPFNLTLKPQFQSGSDEGTAAANTPGSLIVNVGAPYTVAHAGSEAAFVVQRNGVFVGSIQGWTGSPTSYGTLYLGPGITPGNLNYTILSDGTANTYFNSPGSSGQIHFQVNNTDRFEMTVLSFVPAGDANASNGTTAARWNLVVAGPNGFQVYHAQSDANSTARLGDQILSFGPGGASAPDTGIARQTIGTVQISNPALTGNGALTIGSSSTNELLFVSANTLIDTGSSGSTTLNIGGTNATTVYVGNTGSTSSIDLIVKSTGAINAQVGGTFVANLSNGSGDYLWLGAQGSTAAAQHLPTGITFQESVAGPIFQQTARSSDSIVHNFTIQSQAPFATAVTNKSPGNIVLNTPAPASGGATGFMVFQSGGTSYGAIGLYNSTAGEGGLWLGVSSYTAANFTIFSNGGTVTQFNASSTIYFDIGGSAQVQIVSGAIAPFSANGSTLGTSGVPWGAIFSEYLLTAATSVLGAGGHAWEFQSTASYGVVAFAAASTGNGAPLYITAQNAVASGTSNGGAAYLMSGGKNGGTGRDGIVVAGIGGNSNAWTPTGTAGAFEVCDGNGLQMVVGNYTAVSSAVGTYTGLWLGGGSSGLTPNNANYTLLSNTAGGGLFVNAFSSQITFSIGGSNTMAMTSTSLAPNTAGALTLGLAGQAWGASYVAGGTGYVKFDTLTGSVQSQGATFVRQGAVLRGTSGAIWSTSVATSGHGALLKVRGTCKVVSPSTSGYPTDATFGFEYHVTYANNGTTIIQQSGSAGVNSAVLWQDNANFALSFSSTTSAVTVSVSYGGSGTPTLDWQVYVEADYN